MERGLIKRYERDLKEVVLKGDVTAERIALAELPLQIRGFGPVKEANAKAAAQRRDELLAAIASPDAPFIEAAE